MATTIPTAPPQTIEPAPAWSPRLRLVVSLLLIFHLSAVFVAPWSSPPPASDLSRAVAGVFEEYLVAAYLNHGYRFFAPNPGPSHLVRYELERTDGSLIAGRFPDPAQHWPRLLYHRHFMVSETVFNLTDPVQEPPPDGFADERQRLDFENARKRADALLESLARYLLRKHDGLRVKLFVQQHGIPGPADIRQGMRLDDPRLYLERELGEYTGDGV